MTPFDLLEQGDARLGRVFLEGSAKQNATIESSSFVNSPALRSKQPMRPSASYAPLALVWAMSLIGRGGGNWSGRDRASVS